MSDYKFPLYHGVRTNKSEDEIKKHGLCYPQKSLHEDIVKALNYFNKYDTAMKLEGWEGLLVRHTIEKIDDEHRKAIWVTADKLAPCRWWAHANPEPISEVLYRVGVSKKDINEYLNKNYGKNCYSIKLKKHINVLVPDYRLNEKCITSDMINSVHKCGYCNYEKAWNLSKKKTQRGAKQNVLWKYSRDD